MCLVGRVLNELEHRSHIDDETYEAEWNAIHTEMMTRLEAKIASYREAP
jgi:hypothetical protein